LVSIVRGDNNPGEKEIDLMVRRAVRLAGGLGDLVRPGDLVLIKPNLVVPATPREGSVTNPLVAKSIANIVKELKARPIIAESSAVGVDTERAIICAGYDLLRNEGIEVIDLKKTESAKVAIPKGRVIKEAVTYVIATQADIVISVPVMKTHDQTEVTLGLKNMKDLFHDATKRRLHMQGLFDGIVDECTAIKPDLVLIDGIIGQEGLGPMYGAPIEMDLIIAGKGPVATDTVAARVMGFKPESVRYLKKAEEQGLGTTRQADIEVIGERISSVSRRFKPASDVTIEASGFSLISDDRTCTGCRNTVLSSLLDLKQANQLERLRGITMIAGKVEHVPEMESQRLILVGLCLARFKDRGRFVCGCPPNNRDVVGEVLRRKASARYSE
jgi:uncharacterized protein (DUF362 family)